MPQWYEWEIWHEGDLVSIPPNEEFSGGYPIYLSKDSIYFWSKFHVHNNLSDHLPIHAIPIDQITHISVRKGKLTKGESIGGTLGLLSGIGLAVHIGHDSKLDLKSFVIGSSFVYLLAGIGTVIGGVIDPETKQFDLGGLNSREKSEAITDIFRKYHYREE